MNADIRVIVEPNGKLKMAVEGGDGPSCLSITEFLEKELGEVVERQKTSGFYKRQKISLRARNTHNDLADSDW